MDAYVSKYSCQRDGDLPVYIETARLRMNQCQADVALGDVFVLDGRPFIVKEYRHFPNAKRIVVDVVHAGLDPSAAQCFTVYRYKSTYGCNAGETPEEVGQVQAALYHDVHDTEYVHDSRQWIGRYRAYLAPEDARKLDNLSLLANCSETLKVVGIHDLQRANRLPFALVEQSNLKLPL